MNIEVAILRETQTVFNLANQRYLENLPYTFSVYARQEYHDELRRKIFIKSEREYDLGYSAAHMQFMITLTSTVFDLRAQCQRIAVSSVGVVAISDEFIEAEDYRLSLCPPDYTDQQQEVLDNELNMFCMAREELEQSPHNISKSYFDTLRYKGVIQ